MRSDKTLYTDLESMFSGNDDHKKSKARQRDRPADS